MTSTNYLPTVAVSIMEFITGGPVTAHDHHVDHHLQWWAEVEDDHLIIPWLYIQE